MNHRSNLLLGRASKKRGAQVDWGPKIDHVTRPSPALLVVPWRLDGLEARKELSPHFTNNVGHLLHIQVFAKDLPY